MYFASTKKILVNFIEKNLMTKIITGKKFTKYQKFHKKMFFKKKFIVKFYCIKIKISINL